MYPYRRELNEAGFWPPLGLEFVAAVVQRYAGTLDLVDLRMESGRTADFIRPETDLVCFSVNWDRDIEFLEEEIRSVPPGVLTIVGGRHATECPERWLKEFPNVTAVVRGDGEEAMEEICRGVPMAQIAGISFRGDGGICHNPNRTLGKTQDDLYPDRRLRRGAYVVTVKGVRTKLKVDSIASSRGCPFNCTFCSFNRNPWGEKRGWTGRSAESVVDELAEMEAPLVGFTDDLVTHDMDRVEHICDLILSRGIRKKYVINARLEIARRPDVLRKMERAGFFMLLLGVESAQDKTLRSMRKGFDVAKIREYFQVLRHTRMILHGYFILGCVGETVDDMLAIAPFAKEIGLDTVGLSGLRHSPYSGLDELVAASPGYHIADSGKVCSDHCSLTALRQVRRQIHHQFYTPAQIAHIARKGLQGGGASLLPGILPYLPRIAVHWMAYAWRRFRRRAGKRHAHQAAAEGAGGHALGPIGPGQVAPNSVEPGSPNPAKSCQAVANTR
ncbi:MAG: radical SAM protein [Planctomycetota bacterium]|nr:radical SAM protein [Planctomycetota bacterium]